MPRKGPDFDVFSVDCWQEKCANRQAKITFGGGAEGSPASLDLAPGSGSAGCTSAPELALQQMRWFQ